jgi:hypothetical protein
MIGLTKYLNETQYIPVFRKAKSKYLPHPHKTPDWAQELYYYEIVRTTSDPKLPNIVFINDSFTDAMIPFLSESFDTTTFIFDAWRYERNDAIINDQKPDIVMLILYEPHISHLIGVK